MRALTCMIHPIMKMAKPRLVPLDAFDTAVDSRKAKLIIASWKVKNCRHANCVRTTARAVMQSQ